MASENAEIFRAALDAFNRHDFAAFLALCDPDIESHPITGEAEGGTAQGHEGVRLWWDSLESVFTERQAEADDFRDLGDRFVALGQYRARGRGSGLEIETEIGWVSEFRDGLLLRWWTFTSHAEALAEAGLPENH